MICRRNPLIWVIFNSLRFHPAASEIQEFLRYVISNSTEKNGDGNESRSEETGAKTTQQPQAAIPVVERVRDPERIRPDPPVQPRRFHVNRRRSDLPRLCSHLAELPNRPVAGEQTHSEAPPGGEIERPPSAAVRQARLPEIRRNRRLLRDVLPSVRHRLSPVESRRGLLSGLHLLQGESRGKQVLGRAAEALETSRLHLPLDLHSHRRLLHFLLRLFGSNLQFLLRSRILSGLQRLRSRLSRFSILCGLRQRDHSLQHRGGGLGA